MSFFNIDSVDTKAQSSGKWIIYQESQFLIASINNFAFQREFSKLQRPHQRKIDKNMLDPEVALSILCEAMAGTLLLDWKDVVDGKGLKVSFTTELALKVLKMNEDLRSFVQESAMDMENFRQEEDATEGKS